MLLQNSLFVLYDSRISGMRIQRKCVDIVGNTRNNLRLGLRRRATTARTGNGRQGDGNFPEILGFDTTVKRFDVTTNHIVNDVHDAESRSVERVGGEGPPTSGEPYPAERPPISRPARPCILPDVSVIYRSIAIQPDEIVNSPNPSTCHSISTLIKVTLDARDIYFPTINAYADIIFMPEMMFNSFCLDK